MYFLLVIKVMMEKDPIFRSDIHLCSGIGEGFGNHLDMVALVNADLLPAPAPDFMLPNHRLVQFDDALLVAAEHLALAQFFIFPQLLFTGGTFDGQHSLKPFLFSIEKTDQEQFGSMHHK